MSVTNQYHDEFVTFSDESIGDAGASATAFAGRHAAKSLAVTCDPTGTYHLTVGYIDANQGEAAPYEVEIITKELTSWEDLNTQITDFSDDYDTVICFDYCTSKTGLPQLFVMIHKQ